MTLNFYYILFRLILELSLLMSGGNQKVKQI